MVCRDSTPRRSGVTPAQVGSVSKESQNGAAGHFFDVVARRSTGSVVRLFAGRSRSEDHRTES